MEHHREKIDCVIFDWAGTTVDYGCFAPVNAFYQTFLKHRMELTLEEIRKPMGLLKFDHVRALLGEDRISQLFENVNGRAWTEADVQAIYNDFEPTLMETLSAYTQVIPGVLEVCDYLRKKDIKIGSTTGYTRDMMAVVASEARAQGYYPDTLVTPDDVRKGRPYPYMILKNMDNLDVYLPESVIKVGDTISDIKEGLSAGCISVGVVEGSSQLGLSQAEFSSLTLDQQERLKAKVVSEYQSAGAHYTIQRITDLPELIETILLDNQQNDEER